MAVLSSLSVSLCSFYSRYFIGVGILFPLVVNKTDQLSYAIPFCALIGVGFGVFYSIEPANFFKVQ
jgi:hypothetical protein